MPEILPESVRSELLAQFASLVDDTPSMRHLQESIVQAIGERLANYDWVGFYMLDPSDAETLILGPFVGEPTSHLRIPLTQGICGAAAASGKTIVVDDVGKDERYLSCSIKTKSEIVVPIFADGKIIGELDIDSHALGAFSELDRLFLQETARIVGAYAEAYSEG